MDIYHYSNINIPDKIKVGHFGANSYTDKDRQASELNRTFYFTDKKPQEFRFKDSKYRYTINISDKDIYNLIEDPKGLLSLSIYRNNINGLLKRIKNLGYKGALYSVGYNIIILFNNTPYKKKELI